MAMTRPTGGRSFAAGARTRTAANVAVMVLAAVGIFGVVNFLASQSRFRTILDATSLGENTLTPKSRSILRSLPAKLGKDSEGKDRVLEIVSILAPDSPVRGDSEVQAKAIGMVRKMLEAVRVEAGGQVAVTMLDPIEDRLKARAKLQELKVSDPGNEVLVVLGDRSRRVRLDELVSIQYSTRGSFYGGRDEPARIRENRIEEALLSNVLAILEATRPKVYVVTGHGEASIDDTNRGGLSRLAETLRQSGYDVAPLVLAEKGSVPSDAAVLLWVGAERPMLPKELAAFREWGRQGGRFLVAIDPMPSLDVEEDVQTVLADFSLKSPLGIVCEPLLDPFTRQFLAGTPQCAELQIFGENLSSAHPVTKGFFEQKLVLLFDGARALARNIESPSKALVEDLARTTEDAWLDVPPWDFRPTKDKEPFEPKTVMAASTWSSSDAPAANGGEGPESAPALPGSEAKEGRALVLGTSTPLRNERFAYGRDLVVGSIEYLAGREFAAGIGPRPVRGQSMTDVRGLEPRIAGATYLLGGLSFALAGFVAWRRRQSVLGLGAGLVVGGIPAILGLYYLLAP